MTDKGKILVVSPVPSHPADQGNSARIQALGLELKERYFTVDFFYYGMEGLNEKQRVDMEEFWSSFHFMPSLPLPEPSRPAWWGLDDWCPMELCEAVRTLHVHRTYDAIIVNYVWMSRVLEGLSDTLRVIDTHDLFGDRHRIAERVGLEPRWFFTSLQDEDRGFERADLLIGIQDQETNVINSRVSIDAITLGHGVPPRFLTSTERSKPIATFGYLGSANPWNIRSVVGLDRALGSNSDIDWLIAGSLLRHPLQFNSAPYLLGMVAHVAEFYHTVECVINPMVGGTGLKIKTVEALAFGKPVIGTADAFVGLPARHSSHALKDANECVKIMRLYKDDLAFRQEVAFASRRMYFEYMISVEQGFDALERKILREVD